MSSPQIMDKREHMRVQNLRDSATVTKIHQSVRALESIDTHAKFSRRRSRIANTGIPVGLLRLGFSNSIALGDAARAQIVKQAEFDAQQGRCKTLFLDGQPVPADWQLLERAEIRARRRKCET